MDERCACRYQSRSPHDDPVGDPCAVGGRPPDRPARVARAAQCGADFRVVAEAADGAEAVRLGLDDQVDLAVLDVSMPRMTGLQAAQD